MGGPNQRSYHLVGTIAHGIERVDMLDGEVANGHLAVDAAAAPTAGAA